VKIIRISLSVFELPANTRRFRLDNTGTTERPRWARRLEPRRVETIHVMHVATDAGIEGICTVGDARYTRMDVEHLEQLRLLALGEDPLARESLIGKLIAATRLMFAPPGWFGAFDNCLWDIAGKAAGLPVAALLGGARNRAAAYYNIGGASPEAFLEDAQRATERGFRALKDHFTDRDGRGDFAAFEAMRARFPEAELMHDAALATYDHSAALETGRALEHLGYLWLEEPLPDHDLTGLRNLCEQLALPVLAGETLMNDTALLSQWVCVGASDLIRANARHGTTAITQLAMLAAQRGTTVELNGPGGLFGLVHTHLCCGLRSVGRYEYFPDGSRDRIGLEIGLCNPPVPSEGFVSPPTGAGWGAEWDRHRFEQRRLAIL
jgi:L-alanine-DL-glutamate epimerase-like enolase superfamily enzyme